MKFDLRFLSPMPVRVGFLFHRCSQQRLSAHHMGNPCDAAACIIRRFGVSDGTVFDTAALPLRCLPFPMASLVLQCSYRQNTPLQVHFHPKRNRRTKMLDDYRSWEYWTSDKWKRLFNGSNLNAKQKYYRFPHRFDFGIGAVYISTTRPMRTIRFRDTMRFTTRQSRECGGLGL